MTRAVYVLLACGLASPAFAQPGPGVHLPPIEINTSIACDVQREGTADLPGGAGAIVGVDGNLNDHVAIATELSASPRMRAAMAGGRLSTGFFTDGPGLPGRFFAQALAGVHWRQGDTGAATIQIGAGADVFLAPRGISLHWALDYLFIPGAPHEFAGPRVSAGIVVGPRLRRG
jgi:hypothetical protein